MDALKKVFQIEIKKEDVDEDESTILAVVASEKRDRDGEIIRLSKESIDLEAYRKNPVLLWMHRPAIPLGKSVWIKTDKRTLIAKFRFHRRTQISQEIFDLYKTGFLNSFSIGFLPKQKRDSNKVWRSIELLEVSAVTIPSNTDAITQNGYGEKITDNILRKDLSLSELEPEYHPVDFGTGLSNEKLQEIANTSILKALDNLRAKVSGKNKDKIITVEKDDKMITVDLAEVKRLVDKNILEHAMKDDPELAKKIISHKIKRQNEIEMGKLTGKVF